MKRDLTPLETLRLLADALGVEEPSRTTPFGPTVPLEFNGLVSQTMARRVALLSRKLGVFESLGMVTPVLERDGSIAGWRLTEKGRERSRDSRPLERLR